MALAAATATKSQAVMASPGPDGTLPRRPCQHLLPRHFVRASPAGTETGTSRHPIAMAANESRARLIKETSLMQERGEAWGGVT
ncbi:Uracil phosphoribosyltransferase [Dissostichus eleginoides]|uniref:Uracil phosphoribosyltransferase n=1 Tax=Dissostichus eleginoides TaxID=100907 RepID=A0AAD9FL36_DISEL|nr:Uracil phosphoribosyltransferase [Dissostichus eleginoides]